MSNWGVVTVMMAACVREDEEPIYPPPASCSNFAIDSPTTDSTYSVRTPTVTVSGYNGRAPIRWRNRTTGAAGAGDVSEIIETDPVLCPEGCPVRRFGATVTLASGDNDVEIADETCVDTLQVTYVPYPTDCTTSPSVTITMPSSAASTPVTAGEVTVGGDGTGELESFDWVAGAFTYGMGALGPGPWQVVLAVSSSTTFTVRVHDRCGITAQDSIELVVP